MRELLRKTRDEADLSQQELADRLGVQRSLISRAEAGDRKMDLPDIAQWCKGVEISLGEFVRRYEDMVRRQADT